MNFAAFNLLFFIPTYLSNFLFLFNSLLTNLFLM